MKSSVLRCILFLLFASDVYSYVPPFRLPKPISYIEEQMIHKIFADCSWLSKKSSTQTSLDLGQLPLTQKLSNEEIKHKLEDAHVTIPESLQYDSSKPMLIYTPGFNENTNSSLVAPMLKKILDTGTVNLFIYDHSQLTAKSLKHFSDNIQLAGEALGDALARLYDVGIRNYRCLGTSIGGQICGFAGKRFKQMTSQLLDRISSIDPAGPCFYDAPPNLRLDSTDAKFVDILHTDASLIGIGKSIGHVDFYPNGGKDMLGCKVPYCSHLMSLFYYTESIDTRNFIAVECSDYRTFNSGTCANNDRAIMGFWTSSDTPHGDYYLFVNWIPKFALGEHGIAKPGFNIRKWL